MPCARIPVEADVRTRGVADHRWKDEFCFVLSRAGPRSMVQWLPFAAVGPAILPISAVGPAMLPISAVWPAKNARQSNLVEFFQSNSTKSTNILWIKMEHCFMAHLKVGVCIVMQCGIVRCDDILWLSIVYILQYALIKVPMDAHFLHCLVWGIGSDVEAFFKHGDY